MLKKSFVLFLLYFPFSKCISQSNDSIFKNQIGSGFIWTNTLTTAQFKDIPYLTYKLKINKFKFTTHIFHSTYYNHGHKGLMAGGGLGITKSVYPWKNKKWELFYGAESVFIYEEVIANNLYKYFESIYGMDFTLGLSRDLSKHLSLSTQISPALCYNSFKTFKFETSTPGVARELVNYTPKKFTKGLLRLLSLECNYKF